MFHIVLFEPEIPPNTGNVMRLCVNTDCTLHLIQPLGFTLDEKNLRRAGLDYREWADVRTHASLDDCLATIGSDRVFAFTTKGRATPYDTRFQAGDVLLFGPESRGLPQEVRERFPAEHCLRLPMQPDNRSLNLSNAVAVAVFEAWRQCGFAGAQV